jgi:pre-rRNA-processing protein TSR4
LPSEDKNNHFTMWKNGSDINDFGESVRLYQPIQYKFSGKVQPTASFVGGTPSYFEKDEIVNRDQPNCGVCGDAMKMLVQLHVPSLPRAVNQFSVSRSVYVFGCNRSSCGRRVVELEGGKFSLGGGGTVVCRRSQDQPQDTKVDAEPALAKSTWGEDATPDEDDDNDWGVDDDKDNAEKMEAMLKDMEVSGPKGIGAKKKPSKKLTSTSSVDPSVPRFTCYEVRAQPEPAGKKSGADMDEDDVGMATGSDAKIQAMLARYMAEEDDEEILSSIRGSVGGGGTEKDEKMPEDDRAMLTFTDRVKRVPRQVLRCAKDGAPIWSVPQPKQQQAGGKSSKEDPLSVPDCPCGAKRVFEFQLMPSLLHVLEVDRHALNSQPPASDESMDAILTREFANGGQNWGALAIYTCSESCETNREEFVIVQNSVDVMPERRGDGKMVVEVQMDDDDDDEHDEEA